MILHPADLIAAVHNGTLTLIDAPIFMSLKEQGLLHLANGGCLNSAIQLHAWMLGDAWLWQVGYDNLAVLTSRDDPEDVIRVISLNPAHALCLAVLQARYAPHGGAAQPMVDALSSVAK